ncbi:hypothetical protein EVAR_55011_1 [Eumeta japonica]|uniref:Uncharacterized protein n=1 Tax=Eumeta variegata TaxID=151549 RepID=A0A4C1YFX6_EUMVA|nr:hypothetical protein EVAR_55011_1 [Eumeta japonica]
MHSRGKRAGEPLESRWLPPPTYIRNLRGVINVFLAPWEVVSSSNGTYPESNETYSLRVSAREIILRPRAPPAARPATHSGKYPL